MAPRLELHAILETLTEHVYFQPPPSLVMKYPCIRYKRDDEVVNHADNGRYKAMKKYQVTVIDRDPDSDIPDKVAALPLCSFDRNYAADQLNHDVFNLFF